jgi:hypothetical protein
MKRPVTRGDCVGGPRPCPWVSCRHHLAVGGRNRVRRGWQKRPTCSLDLADEGPWGSREIGEILGISHQGVLNIETLALEHARRIFERMDVTYEDLGLEDLDRGEGEGGGKHARVSSRKPAHE